MKMVGGAGAAVGGLGGGGAGGGDDGLAESIEEAVQVRHALAEAGGLGVELCDLGFKGFEARFEGFKAFVHACDVCGKG